MMFLQAAAMQAVYARQGHCREAWGAGVRAVGLNLAQGLDAAVPRAEGAPASTAGSSPCLGRHDDSHFFLPHLQRSSSDKEGQQGMQRRVSRSSAPATMPLCLRQSWLGVGLEENVSALLNKAQALLQSSLESGC